jgi:glycosidase
MRLDRREFHISRAARSFYDFDENLFSLNGNVIFANFLATRRFAQKMNATRDLLANPELTVRAGSINAMGLIDEILHYVFRLYRQQVEPAVLGQALSFLEEKLGAQSLQEMLLRFCQEFPPLPLIRGESSAKVYLAREETRESTLEELILLWLANANPAFSPFQELFDITGLQAGTSYTIAIASLGGFFHQLPPFGPDGLDLLSMLRSPALAVPNSLSGQMEYIREHWGSLLGTSLLRILGGLDLLAEEARPLSFAGRGPGPARAPDFSLSLGEPERFSFDREWMPSLVLLAKNVLVWLAQLSRSYGAAIERLDQIPDEELETIARRGFTGLWLIGLWERSPASAEIKRRYGNQEAVASAYSIYEYRIASRLGGEESLLDLRRRAGEWGVRLACDMVPNHMGIDSPWVMEHPQYFLSRGESPYSAYSFQGPDLSHDPRAAIRLEDRYYTQQDTAVVFERVDNRTGQALYLYHGNDGTSMPWNDTAQLDYLNPDTREAVIQTILQVAKRFPVIRFDAAMTLTKKHTPRLWYPKPGSGGAIPSRSEYAMSSHEFDSHMPTEFWREVVDRVASEVPETLLLAEAFWLMEGYFVRTLGMHRVYNSAFMHMLRDEDNARYRQLMKDTVAFDPEILKRFVNFLSNPDELTVIEQYGDGDKYFGACTLLATLPGLPMIGHGQVEGFSEKYGMEFDRPLQDERPNTDLVSRHEREIFPLLRRRSLFSGVDRFRLYDFRMEGEAVNEDVFAFSNQEGVDHVLVVFHNCFAATRGWIRDSVPYLARLADGRKETKRATLGESLELHHESEGYCLFHDQISGLEYIRSLAELQQRGLYLELGAYQRHVFSQFRQVEADERPYRELADLVGYRGVPSLDEAIQELLQQPVRSRFCALARSDLWRTLLGSEAPASPGEEGSIRPMVESAWQEFLASAQRLLEGQGSTDELQDQTRRRIDSILSLPAMARLAAEEGVPGSRAFLEGFRDWVGRGGILLAWSFLEPLGRILQAEGYQEISRSLIDDWKLGDILEGTLQDLTEMEKRGHGVRIVRALIDLGSLPARCQGNPLELATRMTRMLLEKDEIRQLLGVNRWQGTLWLSREAFEEASWWVAALGWIEEETATAAGDGMRPWLEVMKRLRWAAHLAQYRVEELLTQLEAEAPACGSGYSDEDEPEADSENEVR